MLYPNNPHPGHQAVDLDHGNQIDTLDGYFREIQGLSVVRNLSPLLSWVGPGFRWTNKSPFGTRPLFRPQLDGSGGPPITPGNPTFMQSRGVDASGRTGVRGGKILITGATGSIGRRIVRDCLLAGDRSLVILARGKGRLSASDRLRRDLAAAGLDGAFGARVEVVEGDVTEPWLGLDEGTVARLAEDVGTIYHLAALTSLKRDDQRCHFVNVRGVEEVLRLAWRFLGAGGFERLFHFSTAYVSGSLRVAHAMEDEWVEAPEHANPYEASKWASERLVRQAGAAGLPFTIFRPSIVVGDSVTGEVEKFNVIYPFLKLYAHGLITSLPVASGGTINLVPIDFVSKAVDAIARRGDTVGKTYHLVSDNPPSIETLLDVKRSEFPSMPRVDLLDPADGPSPDLDNLGYRLVEPYLSYLNSRLTFDTSNTRAALDGTDVALPQTDHDFLARIGRYAVERGYLIA